MSSQAPFFAKVYAICYERLPAAAIIATYVAVIYCRPPPHAMPPYYIRIIHAAIVGHSYVAICHTAYAAAAFFRYVSYAAVLRHAITARSALEALRRLSPALPLRYAAVYMLMLIRLIVSHAVYYASHGGASLRRCFFSLLRRFAGYNIVIAMPRATATLIAFMRDAAPRMLLTLRHAAFCRHFCYNASHAFFFDFFFS